METKLTSETPVENPTSQSIKLSRSAGLDADTITKTVLEILSMQSAEDVVNLDLRGKSSVTDFMIVASGRSNRHVSALSDYVLRGLKDLGMKSLGVEGQDQADWVLVDAGDVVIHLFRPEVREFYALEKMWSVPDDSDDGTVKVSE